MDGTTTRTTEAIGGTVGATLRETRERLGLTRPEVASRTRIPVGYLEKFESEEKSRPGPDVYTKIYLKAYGKFLGLDATTLLEDYAEETARSRGPSARRHPVSAVPSSHMTSAPRIIRTVLGLLVVAGVISYFVVAAQRLIAPPAITLVSPNDGMVTTDMTVDVEGRTEQGVALSINGEAVGVDNDGNFSDTIDLQQGVNVIRVVGTKQHSKASVVERRVIVQPKDRTAAVIDPLTVQADQVPN